MKRRREKEEEKEEEEAVDFLGNMLSVELRVNHLYHHFLHVGLAPAACLAQTCKLFYNEMMGDRKGVLFLPETWRSEVYNKKQLYARSGPVVLRRFDEMVREFLGHVKMMKVFEGLSDEEVDDMEFIITNKYERRHAAIFTLARIARFTYHFPFLPQDNAHVPRAFFGIVCPPNLPTAGDLDFAKSSTRERVAAFKERARRERLIPVDLRLEKGTLDDEEKLCHTKLLDSIIVLRRSNFHFDDHHLATLIEHGQVVAEFGRRLRAARSRLDEVEKEMDSFRNS